MPRVPPELQGPLAKYGILQHIRTANQIAVVAPGGVLHDRGNPRAEFHAREELHVHGRTHRHAGFQQKRDALLRGVVQGGPMIAVHGATAKTDQQRPTLPPAPADLAALLAIAFASLPSLVQEPLDLLADYTARHAGIVLQHIGRRHPCHPFQQYGSPLTSRYDSAAQAGKPAGARVWSR